MEETNNNNTDTSTKTNDGTTIASISQPPTQSANPSDVLVPTMEKIDPFLRFLTKATGKSRIPFNLLKSVFPKTALARKESSRGDGDGAIETSGSDNNGGENNSKQINKECDDSNCNCTLDKKSANQEVISDDTNNDETDNCKEEEDTWLIEILLELTHRGVLNFNPNDSTVGFPLPPSSEAKGAHQISSSEISTNGEAATNSQSLSLQLLQKIQKPPSKLVGKGLHVSSEPTAKRRMKVLKWTLEHVPGWISSLSGSGGLYASISGMPPPPSSAASSVAMGKDGEEANKSGRSKRNHQHSKKIGAHTDSVGAGTKDDDTDTIAGTSSDSSVAARSNNDTTSNSHGAMKTNKQHCNGVDGVNESNLHFNDENDERKAAYSALANLLRGHDNSFSKGKGLLTIDDDIKGGMPLNHGIKTTHTKEDVDCCKIRKNVDRQWLPCQSAHAGSHPGRRVRYGSLSKETLAKIPIEVLKLFDLDIDTTGKIDVGEENNAEEFDSTCNYKKRLFQHQSQAIDSSMHGTHTVVCTGTGSGKSLCFLLPVLAKALLSIQQLNKQQQQQNQHQSRKGAPNPGSAAILLFPTKALAQDQYSKLTKLLQSLPQNLSTTTTSYTSVLRAGVIDGDTPHSQRDEIASTCQIILTNPDTLHAAILPNWKKRSSYQQLLARTTTVVVDEAHVYVGAFGAHVSMVLARLKRVCRVASSPSNSISTIVTHGALAANNQHSNANPLFIACSATMIHPEDHFRLLCPIGKEEAVCVLTPEEDGSPCAPKHFFVWNPVILDIHGNSTGSVFLPKKSNPALKQEHDNSNDNANDNSGDNANDNANASRGYLGIKDSNNADLVEIPIGSRRTKRKRKHNHLKMEEDAVSLLRHHPYLTRRRHAADETAFLLAKAVSTQSVRCIAFCKTRSLVEWVYERCISILQSDPATSHLSSRVESYRGGYTAEARRSIEERLFKKELWGVVGTNALELGVDVGGIDLTLHCGYPGSLNSLLQQSGRAGRGKGVGSESDKSVPSCAIMVCFSSPSEQYLWRNPTSLLSRGVSAPPTLPVNGSVVHGHLLCAGEEFPLTGDQPVSCLLNEFKQDSTISSDEELLGPINVYRDGVAFLVEKGLLTQKTVNAVTSTHDGGEHLNKVHKVVVYSTHPVVNNPWQRVSLRSIEPLSYSIVDLSHPMQGGKTDKIHNQAAVMDTIPYSRVFYHAYPGAIIMHRGRKYRIESMESPPPFVGGASFGPCRCSNLGAFAKPTNVQYSTQALSINQITVVKQSEHAELSTSNDAVQKSYENNDRDKKQEVKKNDESQPKHESFITTTSSIAGSGIVTVKRCVHGYKKLSHVNRKELSRTSIVLPPMEYDTYAIWIDADASYLRDLINDFDAGVHALSHAMVAVAPVFVACNSSDLSCDCSRYECTRILLYDLRAGGSGVSAQLYGSLAECLESAIELLEECTSCFFEKGYDGGCPGCLQSIPCDNFHQDLSRFAGVRIGKHLLERLKKSNLCKLYPATNETAEDKTGTLVPRKGDRASDQTTSLRSMNNLQNSVKPQNIVIGRASWMENKDRTRWAEVDD